MTTIAFHGNTVGPVELRYTQSGKAVANVRVAVNRKRGDTEETDFYAVTLWESLAENAAQIDKGTRVVVVGRQTSREFEDKQGQKRTAWDVTADAFGPDLRYATAQITRKSASNGGQGERTGGSAGGWSSGVNNAASSGNDGWGAGGDFSG